MGGFAYTPVATPLYLENMVLVDGGLIFNT